MAQAVTVPVGICVSLWWGGGEGGGGQVKVSETAHAVFAPVGIGLVVVGVEGVVGRSK